LFHKNKENWTPDDSILIYKDQFLKKHNFIPETAIAIAGICLNDSKRANDSAQLYSQNFKHALGGNKDFILNELHGLFKRFKGVEELVVCDLSISLEDKKESCTLFKEIIDELN